MGVSVKSSGTQAATLDSEHTLLATTDAGVYVLSVDLNALAVNSGVGEIIEIRVKKKVLTGGTIRLLFPTTYVAGLIPSLIVQLPPVIAPFGATFTLKQPTTAGGSGRSFDWSVDQIDT